MTNPRCSEADFINLIETLGVAGAAVRLDINIRNVNRRKRRIEEKTGRSINPPGSKTPPREAHPSRIQIDIQDGIVLVGSDAHYWPGIISTAHRAFLHFCKEYHPKVVIMNGDMVDGASVSRYPPLNWDHLPTVLEEIETVEERLDEIRAVSPNAKFLWPLGNHDARFETRLATVAHEFAGLKGFRLKDHFPHWQPCWDIWINNDVVVKHRFKGGVHATHNNTVSAGRTMVTGHLHSLKITPYSDLNGTRWGVDTGTLAEPDGPQFDYSENNPRNHRSGFVMLTFKEGELLWPELISVKREGAVDFRGELIEV
jgi:hypothetical protein